MQLHFFPLWKRIGKINLSSPVEFDWQGVAKEGKWFSKSDIRKTISCALTGLLLLQVLQEKQINSTVLVLNKSIIKIPKHSRYCSSKESEELHSFIDAFSVKGLCFTLFEGPESPYYFCLQKHCGAHERETEGKNPLFGGGRMAGSWLPFFVFFSFPFPFEKASWMIDFWFRLPHPPSCSLLRLLKFSSCLVQLTFRILIRLKLMTELL